MPSRKYSSLSSPSASSSDSLTTPSPRSSLGRRARATSQIPPTINYKFWFDDFHVALVTLDHVAYRVRRDCLENASRHLTRLIAEATKTADKQTPFGCPIVPLNLPSSSLEHFLEVVTDPKGNEKISWLAYRRTSPTDEGRLSFSSLATLARTAHKLGAPETKFAALSRIMHFFKSHSPLSFGMYHESFQDNWEWWSRECGIRVDVSHAIEALNLSHLLFAVPRFPLALYACCLLPPAQLRRGIARQDGVVEELSDDDFERCMSALPLLHIANHDSVAKAFPVEDWQCLEAKRPGSICPCQGKCGVRRIRDAYMAHMSLKAPGSYRADLRDLFSPLKFKSLPYEALFAPGGKWLICQGCAERIGGISETLCSDEAANLERYFYPEPPEVCGGAAKVDVRCRFFGGAAEVDAHCRGPPLFPSRLDAPSRPSPPASELESESSPFSPIDADPEAASRPPGSPSKPPRSRSLSSERPRPLSAPASPPESEAARRSKSPDQNEDEDEDDDDDDDGSDDDDDDDDDDDGEKPRSPVIRDSGCSKSSCSPRLEIEIPTAIGALGWHDGGDSDSGNLLALVIG